MILEGCCRFFWAVENDFLLVGPLDDPASVLSAPRIEIAVQRIVERRARFVSRGDESGTHTRERRLFTLAGVALSPEQVVVPARECREPFV